MNRRIIHRFLFAALILPIMAGALCYAQTTIPARPSQVLKLASDDWCPYVCVENGHIASGFLVDLASEAMGISGYKVEPTLLPFTRAINETASGDIQGVLSPPYDARLRISPAIIYTRSCFYTLNNQNWTYRGLSTLQNVTLGVIPDYNYDDSIFDAYVEKNKHNAALIDMAYGEFAVINNLKKLMASRFTAMVEDEAVIALMARKLNVENKIRQAGCLDTPISITIGFSKADPRSDEWLKALVSGIQQMESSGKIQALRAHYQIPIYNPQDKAK